MKSLNPDISKIVNFIYDKPEVVVRILQKSGYSINIKTATLQQIDKLTFEALANKDEQFNSDLSEAIANGDLYSNIAPLIVSGVISLASSLIGGFGASNEARKQREMMWNLKMAELAQNEKLTYEQIRTGAETERISILIKLFG
jgi:hypothetical protein